MITSFEEVKINSKKFELLFEKIRGATEIDEIFKNEIKSLFLYMRELRINKTVIKIILEQFKYHGFEKFFLGYNSFNFFNGKNPKMSYNIIILGEFLTIPIIFMDDIMDSHLYRNGKSTLYSYFNKKNPAHKKENTLFFSNILLNYLIGRLFSKNISPDLKMNLFENYVFCINRTYIGGISEQGQIPSNFKNVIEIYKRKSHYFTTYFLSKWGSILSGGVFDDNSSLQEILLNITYLVSLRNDVFDIVGKKRGRMEDLLNYSNPLGLFMIKKHLNNTEDLKRLLESRDINKISRGISSKGDKKEVIRNAFDIRNSIKLLIEKCIKEDPEKEVCLLKYLFYADFILKDLLDNLNYV